MNRPDQIKTTFKIRDDCITLGQLAKVCDQISLGGEAKDFLAGGETELNGESENRRGRKIRPGDVVTWPDGSQVTIE